MTEVEENGIGNGNVDWEIQEREVARSAERKLCKCCCEEGESLLRACIKHKMKGSFLACMALPRSWSRGSCALSCPSSSGSNFSPTSRINFDILVISESGKSHQFETFYTSVTIANENARDGEIAVSFEE